MADLNLPGLIGKFQAFYDAEAGDKIWEAQSQNVRDFLTNRVMGGKPGPILDDECDEIIRILDRNGKGNTKDSQAVARAMVPQGAWRRLFNEFHTDKQLGQLVMDVLTETDPDRRAARIDKLYAFNQGRRNNLTGPSGNTVGAFLAAYDPFSNLSVISLNDRRTLIDFLELAVPFDWETASIGTKMVETNRVLSEGLRSAGVKGSARTLSRFCYYLPVKELWKGEHKVKRVDKDISVTVPESEESTEETPVELISEAMQMQALIATLGTKMGFRIWLPKADRSRVLKAWTPEDNLVQELPLGYDATTMKTIEQIDVLWLKKRSIVRAFEVEHTTSVYSGLLRMADLVALQPNINIRLHIVADESRRDKVLQEIRRPVFSLLEGRALSEMCTYLSYDNVKAISELDHLAHLSDKVIEDFEEQADSDDS